MPDIVTAARLAEIKAQAERISERFGSMQTGRTILDLIASLERVVALLRCHKDPYFNDDIGEFLKEFDR